MFGEYLAILSTFMYISYKLSQANTPWLYHVNLGQMSVLAQTSIGLMFTQRQVQLPIKDSITRKITQNIFLFTAPLTRFKTL
jgi:hypothetical protein